MKPGQRINLLKKLAKKLAEFSYTDGDLILRQFNLPWTDQWQGGGDNYNYYLSMVESGKNEHLVELHEYLFPHDPLPGLVTTEIANGWKANHLRLFLSHSSKRALQVGQIKHELLAYGIDAFVAHEDIEPTTEWLKEITKALASCHALAAILCGDFKTSRYCDQEIGFALQRGILVIPVRVAADPYGFMAPLQGVAAFDLKPVEIASEIRKLILSNPTTKEIAAVGERTSMENLVREFLTSSNYGTSTALLKQLESYESLPEALVESIEANWKKNDQITGCGGIPRRMEIFFARHLKR